MIFLSAFQVLGLLEWPHHTWSDIIYVLGCVCLYAGLHAYKDRCVLCRSLRLLSCFALYFETGFHTKPRFHYFSYNGWLASLWDLPVSTQQQVTGTYHHGQLSKRAVIRIGTQVLMLVQQVFYSELPTCLIPCTNFSHILTLTVNAKYIQNQKISSLSKKNITLHM